MNEYGRMAQRHWKEYLPTRYAQIEEETNPEEFFASLGERASQQIALLEDQILRTIPLSEDYLTQVGQRNMARMRAREQVLSEMVLVTPETTESEETEDMLPEEDPRIDPQGMPTDLTHPLWQDVEDDTVSTEEFLHRIQQWRASLEQNPIS